MGPGYLNAGGPFGTTALSAGAPAVPDAGTLPARLRGLRCDRATPGPQTGAITIIYYSILENSIVYCAVICTFVLFGPSSWAITTIYCTTWMIS